MKVDLRKALAFPTLDASGPKKILIGCGVICLFWLYLPVLTCSGYLLEVIRQSSEGDEDQLPDWDRWGDYTLRGWWVFVIGVAFFSVPLVLCLMAIGGALAGLAGSVHTESIGPAAGGLGFAALCYIAATLLALVISFFMPMALLRYAGSLKLGDAFNFGGLVGDIGKAPLDYFITWAVPCALLVGGNLALGSLHFIPLLGSCASVVLTLAFSLYVAMVWAHLLGQYCRVHLVGEPALVSESEL